MEGALLITRGSLFLIESAAILKHIFVICSQYGVHIMDPLKVVLLVKNSQFFSLIVYLINRKVLQK